MPCAYFLGDGMPIGVFGRWFPIGLGPRRAAGGQLLLMEGLPLGIPSLGTPLP